MSEKKEIHLPPEHQKLVDQSRELIKESKIYLERLRKGIAADNKTLEKQRKELNRLLDELGIKPD